MDYSLLVGIHDPSIPHGTEIEEYEEEECEYDDGQSYCISSDELEVPQSPSSTTGEFCIHIVSLRHTIKRLRNETGLINNVINSCGACAKAATRRRADREHVDDLYSN